MSEANKTRKWTVAEFRKFAEYRHRNYINDDLWGPDPEKCSDEFSEFVELERFFGPIDSTCMLLDSYDKAIEALKRYKCLGLQKQCDQPNFEMEFVAYNTLRELGEI